MTSIHRSVACAQDELELLLALSDELRGEAKDFVAGIRAMQKDVTMLTGDHADIAEEVRCRD